MRRGDDADGTLSFVMGARRSVSEDGLDLRAGRFELTASGEPSFQEEPSRAAALEPRLPRILIGVGLYTGEIQALDHGDGRPEVAVDAGDRSAEPRRPDADDGVVNAGEVNVLADHVGAAAELPLP